MKTENHRRFQQISVLLTNYFLLTSTRGSHCSAETLRPWNCLSPTHCRLPSTRAEAPNTSQVRHSPARGGQWLLVAVKESYPGSLWPRIPLTLPSRVKRANWAKWQWTQYKFSGSKDFKQAPWKTVILPPKLVGLSMSEATTISLLIDFPSLATRS